METKELNKKYGLKEDTPWVICGTCEKKYPSTIEDDYSDDCADCEELDFTERLKIKNNLEAMEIISLI